ncbi:MAG: copper chaperone CopZ [Eubacteriaceae bacterium]|nr:copper chaperone CopZ [Eubacteriaceae bacterium]
MKSVLNVDGMSCMHCVNAIKNSVGALDGINTVDVDLEAKTVTVEYDEAKTPLERIKEEIEEQGYDVV